MTGEGPAPCPGGTAVLLLRGENARFLPDEGTTVLDGKIAGTSIQAAAERQGARSERGPGQTAAKGPFRMAFQGTLADGRVTGSYGTPLCRGHVELSPG